MTSFTPRRLVTGVAVVGALLLGSACTSDSDSSSAEPTEDIPTADVSESKACDFLTAAERTELTGKTVDTVVAADAREQGSQCRWQDSDALIQVTTIPAKEWAKSLPNVVEQLESSSDVSSADDKAELARAKKLLSKAATFTDAQACDAFVTLAELGGEKKGSTTTVTPVPITETETGISAQTCSDGDLTSIIYSVPGLEETKQVDRTVTKILASAQKRVAAAR